jgi:hypothetical protein
MKKTNMIATGAALAMILATGAQAESFSAGSVKLENLVGKVEIVTVSGNQVRLDMDAGAGFMELPQVEVRNGVARIYYSKRIKVRQCSVRAEETDDGYELVSVKLKLKGGKKHKLEDYPSIRLEVPAGTDFSAKGGVIFGTAGDLGSVNIGIDSCGDFRMGNIDGDLKANINGSGDFWAGDVSGNVNASINGSGDIVVKSANGNARLHINGSGDIEVAKVKSLTASINGSGDIEVGSTDGEVDLGINGSGDIEVGSGRAAPFEASIHGSGDIAFEGHASGVKVYISGSGDIVVGSYDGKLDTGGHRIEIEIEDGRLHVEG